MTHGIAQKIRVSYRRLFTKVVSTLLVESENTIILFVCPPKFRISISCFSWDLKINVVQRENKSNAY